MTKIRTQWRAVLALGLLGIVVGASIVGATPSSKQNTVTIDVKETDIARVLDAFSQQTGLSVVVGKEVTGNISVR